MLGMDGQKALVLPRRKTSAPKVSRTKHWVLLRRKTAASKVSRTIISAVSTENTFTQCTSNLWKVPTYPYNDKNETWDMKIQNFDENDKSLK